MNNYRHGAAMKQIYITIRNPKEHYSELAMILLHEMWMIQSIALQVPLDWRHFYPDKYLA